MANNPQAGPSSSSSAKPATVEEKPSWYRSKFVSLPLPSERATLMKGMVCSYCKQVPAPPVKLCTLGHLSCRDCDGIMPSCAYGTLTSNKSGHSGVCLNPMHEVELPAYEFLYDRSTFACANKKDGCKETPTGKDYTKHVRSCPYSNK